MIVLLRRPYTLLFLIPTLTLALTLILILLLMIINHCSRLL